MSVKLIVTTATICDFTVYEIRYLFQIQTFREVKNQDFANPNVLQKEKNTNFNALASLPIKVLFTELYRGSVASVLYCRSYSAQYICMNRKKTVPIKSTYMNRSLSFFHFQ